MPTGKKIEKLKTDNLKLNVDDKFIKNSMALVAMFSKINELVEAYNENRE